MLSSFSPWLYLWVDGEKWKLSCLWQGKSYTPKIIALLLLFCEINVHANPLIISPKNDRLVAVIIYAKAFFFYCWLGLFLGDGIRWNDLIFDLKGSCRGWTQRLQEGLKKNQKKESVVVTVNTMLTKCVLSIVHIINSVLHPVPI